VILSLLHFFYIFRASPSAVKMTIQYKLNIAILGLVGLILLTCQVQEPDRLPSGIASTTIIVSTFTVDERADRVSDQYTDWLVKMIIS
jgi:hypothetical protein